MIRLAASRLLGTRGASPCPPTRALPVAALAVIGVMGVMGLACPAHGQARLELRVVPQNGQPGDAGGVVSLSGSQHAAFTASGQVRRFEVQYRVVDTNLADGITPVGLSACLLNISAASVGGGFDGSIRRALLSHQESGSPGTGLPPLATPVNLTTDFDPPAADGSTGMQRPFRAGIPAPAPNNAHPNNGTIAGAAITGVRALSTSPSGQSSGTDWYGVYSFEIVSGCIWKTVVITVDPQPDPNTGNRFSFFVAGSPVPATSPDAPLVQASIGPQPTGGVGACCTIVGACVIQSINACISAGAIFAGGPCAPSPCAPVGACCVGTSCTSTTASACCVQSGTFAGPSTVCAGPSPACCRADFNGASGVSVQDIFDFLAAWFASDPRADVNASGTVTVQDIFDFLAAWFAGC